MELNNQMICLSSEADSVAFHINHWSPSSKDFKESMECLEIKAALYLVKPGGGSIIRLDQENQMSLEV